MVRRSCRGTIGIIGIGKGGCLLHISRVCMLRGYIYVASYEMKAVGLLELCVYYRSESSELWLDSKEGGDPTTNWTDDLLLQGLCRSGLQHSSPP